MNCQVGKEKFGKFIDLAIRILIVRCLKFDNSPNSQNFPTTTNIHAIRYSEEAG